MKDYLPQLDELRKRFCRTQEARLRAISQFQIDLLAAIASEDPRDLDLARLKLRAANDQADAIFADVG